MTSNRQHVYLKTLQTQENKKLWQHTRTLWAFIDPEKAIPRVLREFRETKSCPSGQILSAYFTSQTWTCILGRFVICDNEQTRIQGQREKAYNVLHSALRWRKGVCLEYDRKKQHLLLFDKQAPRKYGFIAGPSAPCGKRWPPFSRSDVHHHRFLLQRGSAAVTDGPAPLELHLY